MERTSRSEAMWTMTPSSISEPAQGPISDRRLVIRSGILPCENVRGWLLRLASLNGLLGIRGVLSMADIGHKSRPPRDDLVACLARVTEVEPEVIAKHMPVVAPERWAVCAGIPGHHLTSRATLGQGARVCPACLSERQVIPAHWDLRFRTACPIHGCYMLQACDACGETIRWARHHVNRCGANGCRRPLSQAATVVAPPEVIDLMAWLDELVDRSLPETSRLHAVFGRMELTEALRLISLLGHPLGRNGSSEDPATEAKTIVETAALALSNWPSGFHALLERTRDATRVRETRSLDEFPLYEALAQIQGRAPDKRLAAAAPVLKAEILAYLGQREEPAKTQWRLRRHSSKNSNEWATADEAAKLLNMHNAAVQRLVQVGHLEGSFHKGGSYSYLLVRRTSLQAFAAAANRDSKRDAFKSQTGALSAEDAADVLGISRRLVEQIDQAGWFTPISRFPMAYFTPDSVTHLVDLFAKALRARKVAPADQCHPWLKRGQFYLGLPDLIEAVSTGALGPVAMDPRRMGLTRYLFDAHDIAEYLKRRQVGSAVSVTQAQEMLNCGWGDVPRLIEAGFLVQAAKGISVDSLQAFSKDYACLSVLADEYEVTPTFLSGQLKARGRRPFLMNNGVGQRMFWRRADVRAEIGAILAEHSAPAKIGQTTSRRQEGERKPRGSSRRESPPARAR